MRSISPSGQWRRSCSIKPEWLIWNESDWGKAGMPFSRLYVYALQYVCCNLISQHPRICYNAVMDERRRTFAWEAVCDLNHANPLHTEVNRNTRSWKSSSLSLEMNVGIVGLKTHTHKKKKQSRNAAKYFLLTAIYCTIWNIRYSKTIS